MIKKPYIAALFMLVSGVLFAQQARDSAGTITGYASDRVNGNVVKNSSGTVQSNSGHAVYVSSGSKRRETTAGPGVDLSFDYNDGSPTWSGGWED
jgi:hypothetical protein